MFNSTDAGAQSGRKNASMQFKQSALARADRDGLAKAALDFGIAESMLDAWRENARLADEVAFLKNAAPDFPKNQADEST